MPEFFTFFKLQITKQTKTENNSFSGAFSVGDLTKINIKTLRSFGTQKINIVFDNTLYPMVLLPDSFTEEIYSFDVPFLSEGLYPYFFEITLGNKIFYTSSINNYDFEIVSDKREAKPFELLIYSEDFNTPECFYGKIMYHIFVDRFSKSTKTIPVRKDAVLNDDWDNGVPEFAKERGGELLNNTFFGGNLYGIVEKLDYLKLLNVSVIYLSPIFKAFSNHKYDTADYMTVDEMFGGEKALKLLLEETKKRGMYVIFDGVFNHTGSDSIYFNKYGTFGDTGAYQSKDSDYYSWYTFKNFPDDYDCWWGIKILPRLNLDNKATKDYFLKKGGVIQKYISEGFSGVRLDVADELNDNFLEELREVAKSENPQSIIIGEVWENAANKISYGKLRKYFQGHQLDSVMNYPWRDAIVNYVIGGDCEKLYNSVRLICHSYPPQVLNCLMNILGTHDTMRIISVLGDADGSISPAEASVFSLSEASLSLAKKRLMCAAILQFTLPGIPCIYYGDETGMQGLYDPFCRLPFKWNNIGNDIFNFYKKLTHIRNSQKAFVCEPVEIIKHEGGIFIFKRNNITVAINMSRETYIHDKSKIYKNLFSNKNETISLDPCCGGIYFDSEI